MKQLVTCIERGLAATKTTLEEVAREVAELRLVHSTLDPDTGSRTSRQADFEEILAGYRATPSPLHTHLAGVMERFAPGLFVDCGRCKLPSDNLALERWFRLPKGHQRRIHGRAHAGVRLVYEGPTLLLALDAHGRHPGLFTADELLPHRLAVPPPCQREAEHRRSIMRRARSRTQRPLLLAELEHRYSDLLGR